MPVQGPIQGSELAKLDVRSSADELIYLVTLSTGNLDPRREPGVPQPNQANQHPFDATLLVDRVEIEKWVIPGASAFVRVLFSSDRRFKFPPRNNSADPNFKVLELDDSSTILKMPFVLRRPVFKGCVNGSGQWTYQWFRDDKQLGISTLHVNVTLNVQTFGPQQLKIIEGERNRFHYLGGPNASDSIARFTRWTTRNLSSDLTQITYSWEQDSGNGAPTAAQLPAGIDPADIVLPPARKPFEAYQVHFPLGNYDPCDQSSIAVPVILSIPTYDNRNAPVGDISPNGLAHLPGDPSTVLY